MYCPTINTKTALKCPAGTYSKAGSVSCLQCPPGYFCPKKGADTLTETPMKCPYGYFTKGSASTCSACPAGKFCPDGLREEPCPLGTFSPGLRNECIKSFAGHEIDTASTWPTVCKDGYYSKEGMAKCL
jgi:hypothetical protein